MAVTVINMRAERRGKKCNLSFAKAELWALLSKYAPPAFSIFDMGVTQASISFKNDFKISQSSAEFETQGRHSIIKHTGGGGERGRAGSKV